MKNGVLLPLDGQQRLTTLFLLHWYIASKEKKIADVRKILHNFSYETRISSREFCERLVDLDYTPEEDVLPSSYIKNQNMYYDIWDTDPTIKNMLVMLDSIHEKFFYEDKNFFELLTRDTDEEPIITFNYLPMENYALTDDLYIKMNARGKNLSDFENFKAKFIQHMKNKDLPFEHFEESIDTSWTDLLWDYRSAVDNTIDEQFMNLFLYLTEMIYLEHLEQQDGNSPFKKTDIRGLISFYDSQNKIEELYELLDLWKNKAEIDNILGSVFSSNYEEGKVRIFDDGYNLIESIINKNNLKVFNKVILFLFMKRLIFNKKNHRNDNGIKNYIRIIRNFVLKVRQRSNENYTPDFRFCRHGIPYISFGLDEILHEDDIYDFIANKMPETGDVRVNSESLKFEKEKAKYILENPEKEEYIHKLEDMDEFKSFIHNILPFIKKKYVEELPEDIETIFNGKYFEKLVRALLSVSDYGIRLGSSYYGDRYYYGNRIKDWYNILSTTDKQGYSDILTTFLEQYYDTDALYIDKCLDDIIEKNLALIDKEDWRYYFVKYPRLIMRYPGFVDADNLIIMLEKSQDGGPLVPHRLNGKQLTSYHACALYLEVSLRLSGNTEYVKREKDAEELSSLMFKSGIKIKLSGCEIIVIPNDELDITNEICIKEKELYENQDKNNKDYIELLEMRSRNILDLEDEYL